MNSSQYYDYGQKPKSHRALKLFVRLGFILVVAFSILLVKHLVSPSRVGAGNGKVLSAETAKPTLSPAQEAAMASSINQAIENHPDLDIGVAVEDIDNDKQYTFGDQQPYIAASVSKVLTATLYLHRVETGQANLSQYIDGENAQSLLQSMIIQSDNDAWQDLDDFLTHPVLAAYAKSIGVTNYDPDQNTQTVTGIATLLGKLYERKLLNASDTNLLLGYMKQADETDYIVASIPPGVNVYHKAGWLDDRVHDAAIIDNGKHPYVLVIFSKTVDGSDYPAGEGMQMYADVTKASLQAFVNG